jgi:hypothetical protein
MTMSMMKQTSANKNGQASLAIVIRPAAMGQTR